MVANINSEMKQSRRGIISIGFGIFNILISMVIFWALKSWMSQNYAESLFLQSQILNIGSKLEIVTKITGLLIGLTGIFEKNRKKTTAIFGIAINVVTIVWTVALFAGFII